MHSVLTDGVLSMKRHGVLADFDDPNLPRLLAVPLVGYNPYDQDIYATTRERNLSQKNSNIYDSPALKGLSSPHIQSNYV